TNIELEWHLEAELFAVAMPRLRLQQVLMNLLLNAVEAIEDLPGHIAITTSNQYVQLNEQNQLETPTLSPGYYVILQVSDSGVGMTQDLLNAIFEPYFTTKATGTGIGLSTTLNIIHTY